MRVSSGDSNLNRAVLKILDGWRSRMAAGHREAARSVLEGHPSPCDASDRRALLTLPLPTIPTGGGKRNWEAHQPIKMGDCYSINYRASSHFLFRIARGLA